MIAVLLTAALLLQSQPLTPGEIVAKAPLSEWREIASDDLVVFELAPDKDGKARRVVVQLVPAPISAGWVANIRRLAAAHWWDGTAITRVQDNYVVQWGDPTEKKPLPPGIRPVPQSGYVTSLDAIGDLLGKISAEAADRQANAAGRAMAGTRTSAAPDGWHQRDSYAEWVEIDHGWPLAADKASAWVPHCYGMVGVGRNLSPDTGTGAELYAVIGQAPRHLDRNIAIVGRVVAGMEHLSSLPRGTGDLGFYKTPKERTPILSARLASELPVHNRPAFEYLSTEGESFAAYVNARANRSDAFFNRPAGGVDICNLPVPVRPVSRD